MRNFRLRFSLFFALALFASICQGARVFRIGPGQSYQRLVDFPWEDLQPGDLVEIYHNGSVYKEKFNIAGQGTEDQPIIVRGIPDAAGNLPVVDGQDAISRPQLDYWNQYRAPIRVGMALVPLYETAPSHVTIENLEVRSARFPYSFTNTLGVPEAYHQRTSGIYIEAGSFITVRNCTIRDCGNGFFTSHASEDVLVEGCRIFDNGIEDNDRYHNCYTESHGITYQFNYIGPQRESCNGNALKDRSSGTVIRYNWIVGGNKQLDLVDSDYADIYDLPSYDRTYVYGNVLLEPDDDGGHKIIQYGGDSKVFDRYRNGTLYFYHNTVVSLRSGGASLFRLDGATVRCYNNILYSPHGYVVRNGAYGEVLAEDNWISPNSSQVDMALNLSGENPGLRSIPASEFALDWASRCRDAGRSLSGTIPATYWVDHEYRSLATAHARIDAGMPDLGAFAFWGATQSVAQADLFYASEDTFLYMPAVAGLLTNDALYLEHPARPVLQHAAAFGSVDIGFDGAFVYTPQANFSGRDSFSYGLVERPPRIVGFRAEDEGALDTGFTTGDELTIRFDQPTNRAAEPLSQAQIDTLFAFRDATGATLSLGTAYAGEWLDRSNALIVIGDATGASTVAVGQSYAVCLAGGQLRNLGNRSPASVSRSPALTGWLGGSTVQWQNLVHAQLGAGNILEKTNADLWLSGASSVQTITGDGFIELLVDPVTHQRMFGLAIQDDDGSPQDLDWAFELHPRAEEANVQENGSIQKFAPVTPIVPGDRLRISVSGDRIHYWHNGTHLYESRKLLTPDDFPLVFDCSLGAAGAVMPAGFIVSEGMPVALPADPWEPQPSDPIVSSATAEVEVGVVIDPAVVKRTVPLSSLVAGRVVTRSNRVEVNIQASDPDNQITAWLFQADEAPAPDESSSWSVLAPSAISLSEAGQSSWRLWYRLVDGTILAAPGDPVRILYQPTLSYAILNVAGTSLLFGTNFSAADGWDEQDAPADQLPAFQLAGTDALVDIRNGGQVWRVRLPTTGHLEVSWTFSDWAIGQTILLQPLRGERASGPAIDMKSQSEARVSGELLEICIGTPFTQAVLLQPGWNLVGTALMSATAFDGLGWCWQGQQYEAMTGWQAEQGVWLHTEAPMQYQVRGLQADPQIELFPGWNLISPAAVMLAFPNTWAWSVEQQRLEPVDSNAVLFPGNGYWVFSPN